MSKQGLIQSNQNGFAILFRLMDILCIQGSILIAQYISPQIVTEPQVLVAIIATLAYLIFAESFDIYRSWRAARYTEILTATSSSWLLVCFLLICTTYFFPSLILIERANLLAWSLYGLLLLCGWRGILRQYLFQIRKRGRNYRTAAVIGVTDSGKALASSIEDNPQLGIHLQGFFDDRSPVRVLDEHGIQLQGSIDDGIEAAKKNSVDILYVAMPMRAEKRIAEILTRCADSTAAVHIIPNFFVYNMLHARWHEVGSIQTLSVYDTPLSGLASWIKRVEDLMLSAAILLLISVPMLAIAIGIKATSKGPVLFKQDRYGMDGRKIQVWKFRSMKTMENGAKVTQATKGDPRITPFGSFLRRTSLDELPQFINVLQGSMSVVGPRPHAVSHNEQYRAVINGYMLRHHMKPGITGWAQINGWRGETDTLEKMEKRVEFDLAYIRNWTVWLDLKIVFKTIFKGFTGTNAY
ncbi:undecaprenyl-phosphate glucose phosphotransferase [Neiella marina]|uniref:Undecaprenyl-phosphate glucose phosphotransferase n=1 Tax=Neiella holothuriorum TaxID=2870530 RepID=A0ABS7EGH9_9GAMM|nr:undecaprenyl-phosphate glucose phosphotransferase [Neiella holothuriorum]MBW8191449.1 undecaprenyl-phosphate glucose phosphotransferase [Neiella holothuriorum]